MEYYAVVVVARYNREFSRGKEFAIAMVRVGLEEGARHGDC